MFQKEAMHYIKERETVRCFLCPHTCTIKPGQTGICGVRKNMGGILYSLNYGGITAYNLDPVEKKPLYHYYPGRRIASVGSYGCNLKCSFCQNYTIAHGEPDVTEISPHELVDRARAVEGNLGIAYTYNEPSIWYEYIMDTARIARENHLKNVLVTNGYIGGEALKQLIPYIDALNIDVKAFNDGFYSGICKGKLQPVLDTVERALEHCHVEITTLIVEGLNDSPRELDRMGEWLGGLDRDIPLHLSRYYPAYKMDRAPTGVEVLIHAREIMKGHLNYVYIGNVPGIDNNTYCPGCGAKLIVRDVYRVKKLLEGRRCSSCGYDINIIM